MRIALLGNLRAIHFVRWANSLAHLGHDVIVLSAHEPFERLVDEVSRIELPYRAPAGYFLNVQKMRRIMAQLRPDLLHVHFASGYGTLGTLSAFGPRILSVWGSDVNDFPNRSLVHRKLLKWTLRTADHITATSYALAQSTRSLSKRKDITVVPFGIDLQMFRPRHPDEESNGFTVGTVRTLHPRYGIDILLRAFDCAIRSQAVADELEDARLMIVGDGPQRAELEQLTVDLGLSERVQFIGRVHHGRVPEYLRQMDVFVAPSRAESFGVAVLEASATELPVVVTNIGGLPEVVEPEETGFVVPPGDYRAIAEAIQRLAVSPGLRTKMGSAGRDLVVERYQWGESLSRMQVVYDLVVGS